MKRHFWTSVLFITSDQLFFSDIPGGRHQQSWAGHFSQHSFKMASAMAIINRYAIIKLLCVGAGFLDFTAAAKAAMALLGKKGNCCVGNCSKSLLKKR